MRVSLYFIIIDVITEGEHTAAGGARDS